MLSWLRLRPYVFALSVLAVTTLLAWLLQPYVSLPNLVLLFVMAAVIVAYWGGRGAAVLASVLGGLAYAVLYVPWAFLDVAETGQYALTLFITVGLSWFISQLTTRWRDQALVATERARELDRLYRYTRELESERLRNSVLSALSHDLRTPLASLVGASSSLMSDEITLDEPAQRELMSLIYDESRRMQVLVENLLELARLESGPVKLQQDWQALEEILGAALAVWRRALAPRDIRVELPDDLPLLRFDPRLLERVFANLFENIGKYTPVDTVVSVRAKVLSDAVTLTFSDNGPGFSEDPSMLFQKFYRGDSVGSAPGAGLGLTICRAIMDAHGGSIVASSRDPQGARFTLSLPISAQPLLDYDDATDADEPALLGDSAKTAVANIAAEGKD